MFDESLYQFGDYVVIISDIIEFYARIRPVLMEAIKDDPNSAYDFKKIEYVPSHYSGLTGAFRKVKEHHGTDYSIQQEARLACRYHSKENIKINIGDISDIALWMHRRKIKNEIVELKNGGFQMEL